MKILLTGTRAPATYDLAKKLTAAGCTVIGSDSMRHTVGQLDQRYPSPRFATEQFIIALNDIATANSVDLIWPTCEEVFYVGQYLSAFSLPVYCPAWSVLQTLHNKRTFIGFAKQQSNAVSYPAEGEGCDVIWKREYSRFATHVLNRRPNNSAGWFSQERIYGNEFSSWGLCREGRLLLASCYSALARSSGAATAFRPVSAPDAIQFMSDIAKSTRYTGSIAFDFIRTPIGDTYVIECNPRLTSGIHLITDPKDVLNAINGIDNMSPVLQASKLGPLLLTKPRECLSLRHLPDVLKGVAYRQLVLSALEFVGVALEHRISLPEAATYDIEFNGLSR